MKLNKLTQNILFTSVVNDDYDKFLKKLFDYSSLINIKNKSGETILHMICYYGMIDKYYAVVNMGAEIEKTNNGDTPLHYASKSGKDNFLILELVKSNIRPDEKNNLGQTSIHLAKNEQIAHYMNMWCKRNNISVIELRDKLNNSVLDTAEQLNNYEVSQYWKSQYTEFNNI